MENKRRHRCAIVGLGLIGGSLGMALRASNQGWEVIGHNRHHEAAGRAQKRGAIDRAEWNLPNAVSDVHVVVVAVPPAAMAQVFRDIAPHLAPGTIVTDVASTKVDVMRWASEILPANVHFVGGHPMAGKETAGIDSADGRLLLGATYCILPGENCAPEAVGVIESIVLAVGAVPYYLDPVEHDSYVAAISHLPFISAAAIVRSVSRTPAWRDLARLAASGFRDSTRTASGDVAMHRDICITNRAAIARWLDAYIEELRGIRQLLHLDQPDISAPDYAAIESFFEEAKNTRDTWMASRLTPEVAELPPMPTPREGLSDMFFGRRNRKR